MPRVEDAADAVVVAVANAPPGKRKKAACRPLMAPLRVLMAKPHQHANLAANRKAKAAAIAIRARRLCHAHGPALVRMMPLPTNPARRPRLSTLPHQRHR